LYEKYTKHDRSDAQNHLIGLVISQKRCYRQKRG